MTKGLYITSAEPYSGKTIMVLGLMEFLVGRIGRIGFFRPIIHDDRSNDSFINLILSRYKMLQHHETRYGCSFETASDYWNSLRGFYRGGNPCPGPRAPRP